MSEAQNSPTPIHERQCWLSYVRYDRIPAEGEAQSQDVWEAPMGIYCTSAAEYDKLAAEALRSKGCRFLGSKTPKPTNLWFTVNGYDAKLAELAPKVDRQNWARWKPGTQVGFDTLINIKPKEEDENPLIITEHEFGQLPDQTKIWPPMDRTWIDPKLKELLFSQTLPEEHQHILKKKGQKEESENKEGSQAQPLIRTYFIADAHLRRQITKVFDLNDPTRWSLRPPGGIPVKGPNGNEGHVQYRSLFKGEAAEELKEVAPYLFDLTLPDRAYEEDKQVPRFHKAFFNELNDEAAKERADGKTHLDTGIFIRTTQTFDEVWRHFRKFTRIQDENGKWFYWRFWDRGWILSSLKTINQFKALSFLGKFVVLSKFQNLKETTGGITFVSAQYLAFTEEADYTSLTIAHKELFKFQKLSEEKFLFNIAKSVENISPNIFQTLTEGQLLDSVNQSYINCKMYGGDSRESVIKWFNLSLLFGIGFYNDPQYGELFERRLEAYKESPNLGIHKAYHSADTFLLKTRGENSKYVKAAIIKMMKKINNINERSIKDIVLSLGEIYPEKFELCTKNNLYKMITSIQTNLGLINQDNHFKLLSLLSALSYSFGHRCFNDPFLPWIDNTIQKSNYIGELLVKIEKRSSIWLYGVSKNLNLE